MKDVVGVANGCEPDVGASSADKLARDSACMGGSRPTSRQCTPAFLRRCATAVGEFLGEMRKGTYPSLTRLMYTVK